jgi:cytochrome c oxidase assembly protein subunit 15
MVKIRNFYKASIITVVLLYILVLVGGLVRVTESGDDCPDWPKCYGSWFPPLTIEDIPQEFNPSQDKVYGSWIEYINRLVGVILGLSMLYTFFKSIPIIKSNKELFYGSLISLLLILVAGWFGGQIATSIDGENIIYQNSVSIHLYIAILTIISLVYTTHKAYICMFPNLEAKTNYSRFVISLLFFVLLLNLSLVVSGSFIRTFLDNVLISNFPYFMRMEKYVFETNYIKFLHPILGFSMLTLLGILWNHIMNLSKPSKAVIFLIKTLLYLIVMQIIIGEGLRFNFINETFRLYHLWISTVILGVVILCIQRVRLAK